MKIKSFLWLFVSSGSLCMATPLKVGDKVPAIMLPDEKGTMYSIPSQPGRKMAINFIPKAHKLSFRCTEQACSIRNGFIDLQKENIEVVFVSNDSTANLKKFKERNQLPFTLLCDEDKVAIAAFGVQGWFGMADRITFLLDGGVIVAILQDVDVRNHADQIIQAFKK
ncbi:MAG TPA: redoxin domain-containing protein [Candidatus Babeliales bacterium]|nr:redoxin domain-containing protein [Candidatus Babeliales bacterium]